MEDQTDNETYATLFDMINGDILNEGTKEEPIEARQFTKKEVQEAMMSAAKDLLLAPAQFRELKKMRNTDLNSRDKSILSNEVKGLRAWALGIIGPTETFLTAKSATKSKIDAIEVLYKRRVIEEEAKGESIQLIAEQIKAELKDDLTKQTTTEILGAVLGDVITTLFEGQFKKTGPGKWKRVKE